MAGHSHAHNIKHRKNAVDSKRAKIFTKMCKDIQICVRQSGSDSPRLKTLLDNARKINLPKDNIDRALAKGSESGGEAAVYQGFALGAAFIIQVYTTSKNRAAANIRAVFRKFGGDLSTCDYLFDSEYKPFIFTQQHSDFEKLYQALEELEDVDSIHTNVDYQESDEED